MPGTSLPISRIMAQFGVFSRKIATVGCAAVFMASRGREKITPAQNAPALSFAKSWSLSAYHFFFFFAAQGLQPFFAAQGLQPFFAAQGLQPFFAAQGLQPFFAAQGLQPFFAAQGLHFAS